MAKFNSARTAITFVPTYQHDRFLAFWLRSSATYQHEMEEKETAIYFYILLELN